MKAVLWVIFLGLASLWAFPASAAELHGEVPGLVWGIPFAGLLLSVAVVPLIAPHLWHHRAALVMAAWTAALLVPQALTLGVAAAAAATWHAVLIEYLPFVALLLALFTTGGGILLEGGPWGTPRGNTLLLAIGTVLAGVMGTTGVSMVLIHPLLRSNAHRRKRVHLVVFFILLCANAGGITTPLGDPPLYIGFLRGVPFGWPLLNLVAPLLVLVVPLLLLFYLLDRRLARGDVRPSRSSALRLRGGWNVALVAVVVGCVLVQGVWHPGDVVLFGQAIEIERLVGMLVLVAVAAASWIITPKSIRAGNLFTWEPMEEVATLFAAIFITIGPVLAMLAAGREGPLAGVLGLTEDAQGHALPLAYFWMAGTLAAVLDNAPTYLVFFQLAGDDPVRLTGELAPVLRALSAGAVFFGGLTYIGNAPNMMVRSIAAHRGIRMPSFFGYVAWSAALLLPMFAVLSLLFFR
jgi:Na+/H+ antiporter NhaD/arsenite permease-like protein